MQRVDGFFRLALLHDAENRVDDDDRHYYDDVGRKLFFAAGRIVDRSQNTRNYRGNDEYQRHRLDKLLQQTQNNRLFFTLGKFVFAV